MSIITVWPIRLLGTALAILLIWGSLSYRLGGRVPGDFYDVGWNKNPTHWQVAPPDTWLRKSYQAISMLHIATAEKHALKALQAENINGKVFAQLLNIYNITNQSEKAEKVLALASEYSPARARTRAHIAAYWLKQERWDKVIEEWDKLLIRINNREMQTTIFPNLLQLIQNPSGFTLFSSTLESPPKWWDSFYSYLIREKVDTQLLNTIYQARTESEAPLSKTERVLFVRHLLQNEQWNEANFVWLSGLDERELELSGLIFDGGFEGDSFNSGFDWQIGRSKGIRINTANTTGVTGRRALRVLFNNKKINFRHVSQRLTLSPGNYLLNYRYRLNRLKNPEGLSWRIRCVGGTKRPEPLLESVALKGRSPWEAVNEKFTVPTGCPVQLIRLEANSRFTHKHTFNGSIWFDDFKITRNTASTTEPQQ